MSAPHARRGFLRGLATLPLIGGSVALIGKPTAAAVPPSPGMMATYLAWLHFEQRVLASGLGIRGIVPGINPGADFHDFGDMTAATGAAFARAPIVLAAAGCTLTSPEAEETWSSTLRTTTAGAMHPDSRDRLLNEYESWLGHEWFRVARELRGSSHAGMRLHGPAHEWHQRHPASESAAVRANVLMATVNCDWRREARL